MMIGAQIRGWCRPGFISPKKLGLPLSALLGGLVVGCGLDSGFEELGDELISPDIGYIESPGRQISAGRYRRFSVRAPTLDDRFIVAFEGNNLVLIRFEENGDKCEVGAARAFGLSITGETADLAREPVLPYLATRDADGRGELRFTDFACNSSTLRVPDVPLSEDALVGPGQYHLIARNGSNDLLAIDPWAEQPTLLGSNVSFYRISDQRLWSVEQNELVLRDATLEELGRAGTDLSEIRVSRSPLDVWAAYVDNGSLYVVEQNPEGDGLQEPQLVSEDACHVAQVGSSRERVLSYHSPCATRHLVIHDLTNDERFEYADDVIATSVVARSGMAFDLNYWTGPEGDSGTLWIVRAGQPPARTVDNALIQTDLLFRNTAFAITDWDGEVGKYVSWRDVGGQGVTTTIAEGVAELNSLGLIANYQDGVGDLLMVRGDDTTFELGTGVPLESTRGRAFVGNAMDGRGELFVLDPDTGATRGVAQGVTRGAFMFSVQIETLLMMLSDYDEASNTATLQVRLLDTGDQFQVSDGVSELVEVGFPRPGVLYGVPVGSRAGLWFAGVR
jgi:hypothetical protein